MGVALETSICYTKISTSLDLMEESMTTLCITYEPKLTTTLCCNILMKYKPSANVLLRTDVDLIQKRKLICHMTIKVKLEKLVAS